VVAGSTTSHHFPPFWRLRITSGPSAVRFARNLRAGNDAEWGLAALRAGLLEPPFSTASLPPDIGRPDSIPGHIRRAVMLRDQHRIWPGPGGCDVPASACDVHHPEHKKDGGPTSVPGCGCSCEFHHEIAIHRWGWKVILHPDGSCEATSPDGRQTLRKHPPPDPDG
jgi:hypothetical protein